MATLPGEIRLALTIGVNVFVVIAAARFVKRQTGLTGVAAASDSLLLWYLVQYISVGVPGMLGLLNAPVMLLVACAIATVLWMAPARSRPTALHAPVGVEKWVLRSCVLLVVSYQVALLWQLCYTPQIANDPLTYHLPAAVHWIQQGRLALFETWLYNPANTYSPLAGSVFIAWLMAPMKNDILARFVQMPVLLLIFFATIELLRGVGARMMTAILTAAAVAVSRPVIGQTILAKDDLFVAAFLIVALAGLTRERLSDRFGPWRVGVAIGLLLATKYTAMLCLPILLLAIDAPIRARWRGKEWLVAVGCLLLLAGPWYLRNWLLTGNPVYPLMSLFTTVRTDRLASWEGIRKAAVGSYLGLPTILWGLAIASWVGAILMLRALVFRESAARALIVGPVIMILMFLLKSPYDEVRFILPAMTLLLTCSAVALPRPLDIPLAAVLLGVSLGTSFVHDVLVDVLPGLAMTAVLAVLLSAGWMLLPSRSWRIRIGIAAATIVGLWVYVQWGALVVSYRHQTADMWSNPVIGYGELADAWTFVRNEVPADQTVAYANTFYIYPLYGMELDRHIVYAPVRAGLKHIHDLPRIDHALAGEQVVPMIARATIGKADRNAWLSNLRSSGAGYVLIKKSDLTESPGNPPPPELGFAEQDPGHFRRVFDNPAAAVYRILP